MKRLCMILVTICILVVFVVGISARHVIISQPDETEDIVYESGGKIYYVHPPKYCMFCDEEQPYYVKYEPWTKRNHVVRHYCIECRRDQLGGVISKQHRWVDDVCEYCGEER